MSDVSLSTDEEGEFEHRRFSSKFDVHVAQFSLNVGLRLSVNIWNDGTIWNNILITG